MSVTQLVLGGTVKKIVHASDIHIRTGDLERSRYAEYQEVFQEFIRGLPALGEDGLVVFTGDIFHNKGKIEPAGICLAQFLLDELLDRSDVLMICGNHDYRQEDPDIPDMIYSMYHRYFEHRVQCKYKAYYLNKTGYYRYKNIIFSVLDIRDVLKSYNTVGRVEGSEAVRFPPASVLGGEEAESGVVKIGLFHGYYSSKEVGCVPEFNPQWSGYDFMLLGDIHKGMVVRQGGCVWGYPGSLIQQDFGESYFDHGYLLWDVVERKAESVGVVNRWGYCTVQCRGEELYLHVRGKKWISAREIGQFPEKAILRVLQKADIDKVRSYFSEKGMPLPRGIQVWNGNVVESENGSGNPGEEEEDVGGCEVVPRHGLEELNACDKWMEFLGEEGFREFLEDPHRLRLPAGEYGDIGKKVQDRNGKIGKAVDEFMNYCSVESAPRVHLRKMEWAYIMCYGEGNSFDFDKIDGQIALLNGKNAMGKSSFMDVICIGLFGDPTKMRQMVTGKKYSDKIIHSCKPGKVAPFVRIQLEVNGEVFEIYRAFGSQSSRENSILQTAVKVFALKDSARQIVLEGVSLVDKWVAKTVGSMEAVLMSTMLCQVDLNNFFYLKQEDQKAILDKALQLDKVSLYGKILKEACLGYGDVLQAVQTAKGTVAGMLAGMKQGGEEVDWEKVDEKMRELRELKKIYGGYITKKVAGKNCEADYKKAELEWQVLGLAGVDLEGYYGCKERLKQMEERYNEVKDVSVFKNGEELLEKTQKKYKAFMEKKPKCEVSEAWVKQQVKKYEEWCAKNKGLEKYGMNDLLKELNEIEKKRLQLSKPTFKKRREVKEEVARPTKLINLDNYGHLEGVVLPKKKGWRKIGEELKRLDKIIELGDNLSHNDDCEACCLNREYLEGLCSYKLRLEKSLEGMVDEVGGGGVGGVDWEQLEQAAVYQENRDYNDWLWFLYETESVALEKDYRQVKDRYDQVYQYRLEKKQWEETMEKVRGHQAVLADYNIWCGECKVVTEKLDNYQKGVDKRKLELELAGVREEYDSLEVGVESFLAYEKYKNEWFNYRLGEVEKELGGLEEKKIKWKAQKEQLVKQKELLDKFAGVEKILEERLELIKRLDSRFMGDKNREGYKEWIYKEKVVPLLNRYMNAFLEQFESFTFKMEYKNKVFVYLLQDRGNEPTLDKASGYQNFITGLGLRITLAMLGAVGQQFKHLFIDEGFTACDMGNMAKVPLLLKSVMTFGQYKSIILMSHLENVRDCASRVIDIERKDPYSYIRF